MIIVRREVIVFSGPREGHAFPDQKDHTRIESPDYAEQVYGSCNCQFVVVRCSHIGETEEKGGSHVGVECDPDSISDTEHKAGEWPILTR